MTKLVKWLERVFIDGLSGMAMGLFATLIIGTIIKQVAPLASGDVSTYIALIGSVACCLTGAGIGCGVACKFKESPLVVVSCSSSGNDWSTSKIHSRRNHRDRGRNRISNR